MTLLELLLFLIAVAGALRILAQKWGIAESGKIGGDVMRHVQRQQDLRELLLTYDEEAGSDSQEHLAPDDDFTAEREGEESDSRGGAPGRRRANGDVAHSVLICIGVVASHPLRTIEFGRARIGTRHRG